MKSTFRPWLLQGKDPKTVQNIMSETRRVEECYSDLDEHFDRDQLRSVVDKLNYTTEDERRGILNPSKIPIDGDIRTNLPSYKHAIKQYCDFRRETTDDEDITSTSSLPTKAVEEAIDDRGQTIGLERDLQVALRGAIEQLDPGLSCSGSGKRGDHHDEMRGRETPPQGVRRPTVVRPRRGAPAVGERRSPARSERYGRRL